MKTCHLDLKFSAHFSFQLFWLLHQFLPQLRCDVKSKDQWNSTVSSFQQPTNTLLRDK